MFSSWLAELGPMFFTIKEQNFSQRVSKRMPYYSSLNENFITGEKNIYKLLFIIPFLY